jgi:hypothetical protein
MTQVALKRCHQVVTVPSFQKTQFIANQSLIYAIIINWCLPWEVNEIRGYEATSTPTIFTRSKGTSLGVEICAK